VLRANAVYIALPDFFPAAGSFSTRRPKKGGKGREREKKKDTPENQYSLPLQNPTLPKSENKKDPRLKEQHGKGRSTEVYTEVPVMLPRVTFVSMLLISSAVASCLL